MQSLWERGWQRDGRSVREPYFGAVDGVDICVNDREACAELPYAVDETGGKELGESLREEVNGAACG